VPWRSPRRYYGAPAHVFANFSYRTLAARPSVTSDLGIPLRIRPGISEGRAVLAIAAQTHGTTPAAPLHARVICSRRTANCFPRAARDRISTATSSTGSRDMPSTSHPNRRLHTNVVVHNARRSTPRSNDSDSFRGPEAESLSGRSCVQDYREHDNRARRAERRVPTCSTPGRTRGDPANHGAVWPDPKDPRRNVTPCHRMRNSFVNTTGFGSVSATERVPDPIEGHQSPHGKVRKKPYVIPSSKSPEGASGS